MPITADTTYGERDEDRSTDVMMGYERYPVFVEVVSGPLRAATLTRGNLEAFEADVDRLVVAKCKQLDRSIEAFFDGHLMIEGAHPAITKTAYPVIITSHDFPHAETIIEEVEETVRAAGYLTDNRIGPLSIVSAEELFFCEGHMEQGRSFLRQIRGWKSGPLGRQSFKNHLIELGSGRAPGSDHFERLFSEATAERAKRLFGKEYDVDEIHERLGSDDA